MQNDKELWIYFPMDRGGVDKRARRRLADARCVVARAHWCSPAAVEEDESDEAVPEGCSPVHERSRRGGAMEVKNAAA
jgi:hypothetical protein